MKKGARFEEERVKEYLDEESFVGIIGIKW